MNVYEIVTSKIVNLLETGVVPWRQPWTAAGLPRNLPSKKPYRGINYFLLSATKFVSPYWLTFNQARALHGSVKTGAESTIVVFWKVEDQAEDEDLASQETTTNPKARRRFLLRYYRVFNVEQCDLPQAVIDKLPKVETYQHDPINQAQAIIANMPNPPAIERAGSKAFYSSLTDSITLPPRELFTSAEEEAATTFHELAHSTGHQKRLAREGITEAHAFGDAIYSREELIAEMSAAFLCAEAGISQAVIANQAAYLAGWLAKLKSDGRLVVSAAAQAQRAADYILDRNQIQEADPQ